MRSSTQQPELIDVRPTHAPEPLCQAVHDGLTRQPKSLPTRLFYDHRGSDLFEQITELPEYYLTRSEQEIFDRHAGEIVAEVGANLTIVEFGSGSSKKTRTLLDAALTQQPELRYVPIDISRDFLRQTAEQLLSEYPRLTISALTSEYFDAIDALPKASGPRLILFLGSNIGNLTTEEARSFLSRLASQLSPHDRLLIGTDLAKDPAIIEPAYNDAAGVTARFNLNLLARINAELHAHFDLDAFRHEAPYDEAANRIEMRLVSRIDQDVMIEDLDRTYHFEAGEAIHTEWSHKYTEAGFRGLAAESGLRVCERWIDDRGWFAEYLLGPTER